jgi:hypothetical protein
MSKYRNCLVLICNVMATHVVKQTFFLEKKSTAVEQKAAELAGDRITATMNCWNYWASPTESSQ